MPSISRLFGRRVRIPIPSELADEAVLLAHLGLGSKELKKIWWYRERMYKQFSIAKRAGKTRLITAPNRRLKFIQRKIAFLLGNIYRVRNPVHGFVPNRSVKTNAEAHRQRCYVVNIDLQDFFKTITESRVRGLLISLGICDRVAEIVARVCCINGYLPQGAPTSPVISNMICFRLDTELLGIAKNARAIYTRYADDITFSSYQPPAPLFEGALPAVGRFSPKLLAQHICQAFQSNGFMINPEKSHFADRNSRRIVTGVKINSGLNVDRRYVRHIRALLHSIETLGLAGAQTKFVGVGGKGNLAAHLRGKISYLTYLKGQTDPVVRGLALRYNKTFKQKPISLAPTEDELRERSVWIIEHSANGGEQGTAFFLKGIGLVTAEHCVEGISDFTVYHPTKPANRTRVTVLKRCEHRDLAILGHSLCETEYYELGAASRPIMVGDAVSAYGYPGYGPGDRINVRPGVVTSLPVKSTIQMIEVTQELTQGMSGGPMLNMDGDVVGVIRKGGPSEGRQLAVHLDVLLDWRNS